MKLTKDDFELLCSNRNAFLVKAYLSYDPTPTVRECAEVTGISVGKCHNYMKQLADSVNKKMNTSVNKKMNTEEHTGKGYEAGIVNKKMNTSVNKKMNSDPTLTLQLRAVFDTHYLELSGGEEFYWDAKQMSALKSIGKKLTKGMQDKGISPSEEAICQNFKLLLSIIEDKWILDNLSPAIINSKYNDIRTQYARRTTAQPARGASHKGADFASFYRAIEESMQ